MTARTKAQKQAEADAAGHCRRYGCHRPQQRGHYCEAHAIWMAKRREYNRLLASDQSEEAAAMVDGLAAFDAPCDCADCLRTAVWQEDDE